MAGVVLRATDEGESDEGESGHTTEPSVGKRGGTEGGGEELATCEHLQRGRGGRRRDRSGQQVEQALGGAPPGLGQ